MYNFQVKMDLKVIFIAVIINIASAHRDQDEETVYIVRKLAGTFGTGHLSRDDCITKEYLENKVRQLLIDITGTLGDHKQGNTSLLSRSPSYATRKDLEDVFNELLVNISSRVSKGVVNSPNETSSYLRDCEDVQNKGHNTSGIYTIYPGTGSRGISVRCDMDTTTGGWTVIQQRVSHSDFYKNWSVYAHGFGDLRTNFWLGNDIIHTLTNQGNYELRIDLTSMDDQTAFAEYNEFSLGDSKSDYKLYLDGYYGNAGDSLSGLSGMKFSTYDKDNDMIGGNCAVQYSGAWWYDKCHQSNLNGMYGNTKFGKGINWSTWKGYTASMKTTEMKIRKT